MMYDIIKIKKDNNKMNKNKNKLWLLEMNLIDLNEDGCLLNGWYSNVEDVKGKFNKDGYYRFNCGGDSNILIDSIEYIGIDCYVDDKKLDLDNGDWLSEDECVYCVDGMEYIKIENKLKKDNRMIKVNRSEIKEIDVNDVNKFIDSDDVNLNRFDWDFKDVYKGEGIYEIEIGSRGEINDIVLNNEFESIEQMKRKDKDYEEEFYFVSNYGNYIEFGLYEEYSGIFINVVGEVK